MRIPLLDGRLWITLESPPFNTTVNTETSHRYGHLFTRRTATRSPRLLRRWSRHPPNSNLPIYYRGFRKN